MRNHPVEMNPTLVLLPRQLDQPYHKAQAFQHVAPNQLMEQESTFLPAKCADFQQTLPSFTDHYYVTHKEMVFICKIEKCGCFYFSQNGLRLHCKSRHYDELACPTCGTICLLPAAYTVHMEKHNSKSSIICSACSKTFTRVNDKDKHFKYRCPRNPNRIIKCKNCNVEIPGAEEGLATHLKEKHGQTGIFICLHCHRLFAMEKKLDRHNETCMRKNPQVATQFFLFTDLFCLKTCKRKLVLFPNKRTQFECYGFI